MRALVVSITCPAKWGSEVLFPNVEVRHLHAVTVLAEELNFTRAADRLHITQPALSKQITELEKQLGYRLFVRDKKRTVELTDAGRTFVQEARSAMLHTERAVQLSRAISEGSESVLTIGRSPCADPAWISAVLATRLPLFPKLRVRLKSQFAPELVRKTGRSRLRRLPVRRCTLLFPRRIRRLTKNR